MKKIMIDEMERLEKETLIKGVIYYGGYNKIFYTKNMKAEFARLKIKFLKKKLRNKWGKINRS